MADHENFAFDKIMDLVGRDGKFQKIFCYVYNVALVCFATMAYMNVVLILNEPDHNCFVPRRENFSLSISKWKNLTLPIESDSRGFESVSTCRMFNISNQLHKPIDEWKFDYKDSMSCVHGYDYDKTWYKRTVVSDNDWICDKSLHLTNTFAFHRIGEIAGAFFFGQLGDAIGRRPVFYLSVGILVLGRILSALTPSIYFLFAMASVASMLSSTSVFITPLIIAMETSNDDARGRIAMMQSVGWTTGMSVLPLIFWAVGDWVWFLAITTFPILLFVIYPKYMIESPRWLATKRHLKRCASELNKIAKINGKKIEVTVEMLEEMLPKSKVEEVYGMASLFTGWRIARNTLLIIASWSTLSLTYFVLIINSTRMGGNPFLSFLWQSAVELPAYALGRWLCDNFGRRVTNAVSLLYITLVCLPILAIVRFSEYELLTTILVISMKFSASITFFAVNLQAAEIYPTCLRQSGISVGNIFANVLGVFAPYVIYLGTEYDVRYPYLIMAIFCFIGFSCAMNLPETLHHKLPNTLQEAKMFGIDQKFWSLPKKPKRKSETENENELESLSKLDQDA